MSLTYQDANRSSQLNQLTLGLGVAAALEIFTGAPTGKTAGVFNADPAGKIVSLPAANPAAPAAAGGVLTFGTFLPAIAQINGTPASFRIKSAANGGPSTVIVEGTAGVGSGDLVFSNPIVSGNSVSITSATITEGNP